MREAYDPPRSHGVVGGTTGEGDPGTNDLTLITSDNYEEILRQVVTIANDEVLDAAAEEGGSTLRIDGYTSLRERTRTPANRRASTTRRFRPRRSGRRVR